MLTDSESELSIRRRELRNVGGRNGGGRNCSKNLLCCTTCCTGLSCDVCLSCDGLCKKNLLLNCSFYSLEKRYCIVIRH